MAEVNTFNRTYQLRPKDIFCVDVEAFLKSSILWGHNYQILGTYERRRKHWWQFWKPWKIRFIKIMYLGDNENGQD